MKITLFLISILLLVFSLFLLNIFAQSVPSVGFGGHQWSVKSVAFSPDGSTLASLSRNTHLWNTVNSEHKLTLNHGVAYKTFYSVYDSGPDAVAFSPDGRTLASGGSDQTIRLWHAVTGEHKLTLKGHQGAVTSVAFSPDGSALVSGSADETIRFWNVVTGDPKLILSHGQNGDRGGPIASIAYSPDGNTLASGHENWGAILLWNVGTGEPKLFLNGHEGSITSVAFSPDGSTLASGSWDTTIRLWHAVTGEHKLTLKGGHRWEAGPLILRLSAPEAFYASVTSVAFSPDGSTLASGGNNKTICLWNVATGEHKMTLKGHQDTVYSVAFSPDGRTLASGSRDKTIRLWKLPHPE